MPEESEKRTSQKVMLGVLALMALLVLVQFGRTLWIGYGVLSGSKTLGLFSETFAVLVMSFVMTLMALAFADMEARKA